MLGLIYKLLNTWKNFFNEFYAVFVYKNIRQTQLFEKWAGRLSRWFLHEGPSETDKSKSLRFSTTVALFWTWTNNFRSKFAKWRKTFEKKIRRISAVLKTLHEFYFIIYCYYYYFIISILFYWTFWNFTLQF